MKPHVTLSHDYATANPTLVRPCEMREFPDLRIELFHSHLAKQLDITEASLIEMLTGGGHALAYSGHQFGQFVPILGDGRALLLGELKADSGLVDIHVKGVGRTPFSRSGDGRYPLEAAKKEYLFSWALEALHVPTTKVLAVLSTGEQLHRHHGLTPGALVVRVATSHIRVGTFQYAALSGEQVLGDLVDYTINRHYPGCSYAEFFHATIENQAHTVAEWMRLGFLHGVINTDNTTVTGESIDFGPCAWAESFNPNTVYSSIDTTGRYQFGHQPEIIGWNLARLAECLVPLIGIDQAQQLINEYPRSYHNAWLRSTSQGLGFEQPFPAINELIDDLYDWLQQSAWDTATTLRLLGQEPEADAKDHQWQLWLSRFYELEPDLKMLLARNPLYIPRNHLVAAALKDKQIFAELLEVLAEPFQEHPLAPQDFTTPSSPEFLRGFLTFCGT